MPSSSARWQLVSSVLVILSLVRGSLAVGCSISSANAGSWSAGATWAGAVVPTSGCNVTLLHNVDLDVNVDLGTGVITLGDGKIFNLAAHSIRVASFSDTGASSSTTLKVDPGASFVCTRQAVQAPGGVVQGTVTVQATSDFTPTLQLATVFSGTFQFLPAVTHANVTLVGGTWTGTIDQNTNNVIWIYVTADTWINNPGTLWTDVHGIAVGVTLTVTDTTTTGLFHVHGCAGTIALRGPMASIGFSDSDYTLDDANSESTCVTEIGAAYNSIYGPVRGVIRPAASAVGPVRLGVQTWFVGQTLALINNVAGATIVLEADGRFVGSASAGTFSLTGNMTVSGSVNFTSALQSFYGTGSLYILTDGVILANTGSAVDQTLRVYLTPTHTLKYDIGTAANLVTGYDSILHALRFAGATVLVTGTSGAAVTIQTLPWMTVDSTLLVDTLGITLKLNGTWRGTVGATNTFAAGSIVFRNDAGYQAYAHPVDPLTLTGTAATVTGAIMVRTGGWLQLGRPTDALASDLGLNLVALTVTQELPATNRVALCSARVGPNTISGGGLTGPLQNCTTRLVVTNSDSATVNSWLGFAGRLRFVDSCTPQCTISVPNALTATTETASIAQEGTSQVIFNVGTLTFAGNIDYSGVILTVQTSLVNSLSRPVRLGALFLDAPTVLSSSLCAQQCVFQGLSTNNGLTYTIPAGGQMYLQGTVSINGGVLTVSAGAVLDVTTNGIPGFTSIALPTATSVLRFAPDVTTGVVVTGLGSVVFTGTAQNVDLSLATIDATVTYQGPAAGHTLTVANSSPLPSNLTGWNGELIFGADPSANLAGYVANSGAKLTLQGTASGVTMAVCWMKVGSSIQTSNPTTITLLGTNMQATLLNSAVSFVADQVLTSRLRLPSSLSISLGGITVKPNTALVIANAVECAAQSVEVDAGATLALASGVSGIAKLYNVPTGAVLFDGTASASPIVLSGVRINSTGMIIAKAPVPTQRINLLNGAGFVGTAVQAQFQNPSTNTNQRLEIFTLDSVNGGISLSDAAAPFAGVDAASTSTAFAGAKFVLNTCVMATGTLQANVNITALSQCDATAAFAGCNAVACNSAAGARAGCTALRSTHTCMCAAGWTGAECQTNVNECASTPCMSGGVCRDLINAYNCTCAAGYMGNNCQTNINECASNPCPSGSQCVDGINSYTCNTLSCSSACQDHGTCVSGVCVCNIGFSGTDCATAAAALPTNQIELAVTNYDATTFSAAVGSFLGATANGSVTVVSTRSGANGVTIVVLAFTNTANVATLLSAVNLGSAPAALNIQSARVGSDSPVANGQGNASSAASKPPISDGAAIGLVLAGLVVVIILISIVWYCCGQRDTNADPKTRPATGSNADKNAVELQVR